MASPSTEPGSPFEPLTLLCAISEQVHRAPPTGALFDQAVTGLVRATGAAGAALLVYEEGRAWVLSSAGLSDAMRSCLDRATPWRADERDAAPLAVTDAGEDDRLAGIRDVLAAEGFGAVACVPVMDPAGPIGGLILLRGDGTPFGQEDLRFAAALAAQLGPGLWRIRNRQAGVHNLGGSAPEVALLEVLATRVPSGVLVADAPSGRIVLANATARAILGPDAGRTGHLSDYAGWAGYDASGRLMPAAAWPLARSVLLAETVDGEEIELRRGDGTRRVVRMGSAPVLDGFGRPLAAVATLDDVTDERYRHARGEFLEDAERALTATLDPVATLSALARLAVRASGDWCVVRRHGFGDRFEAVEVAHHDPAMEDRVRRAVADPIPGDSGHALAEAVRRGEPRVAVGRVEALALLGPDGAARIPDALAPTAAMVLPLMARGRGLGALTVVRTVGNLGPDDVALLTALAERAGLAVDNALLYEQARIADRQKSSFLAVMSHEFRTPLSAILGYADILITEVHGELNPRQRSHVDRVKASVRHLSHLVDEILTFASTEEGRERIRPEPLDAVAVVQDVAGIMEPIAEVAGLDLRVETPGEPVTMLADGSKLRQVLINLVSNAIKYTPEGHVALRLCRDERVARFTVVDTGPGIAEAHFESVFEPFWQVDAAEGGRITGSGLGLTVARRLARLMGGDIRLRSKLGSGCVFEVELPLPEGGPTDGVADAAGS